MGDRHTILGFVGPYKCVMCNNTEETLDHFFITCVFFKEV